MKIEELNKLTAQISTEDNPILEVSTHENVYKYILSTINFCSILEKSTIETLHTLYCNPSLTYHSKLELTPYRTCDIAPLTLNHKPPMANDVEHFMEHFLNQINTSKGIFSPMEYAVLCHKRFLDISPFSNNNLEVSKLLLNYFLLQEKQICFLPEDDTNYFKVLAQSQQMDYPVIEPLIEYINSFIVHIE